MWLLVESSTISAGRRLQHKTLLPRRPLIDSLCRSRQLSSKRKRRRIVSKSRKDHKIVSEKLQAQNATTVPKDPWFARLVTAITPVRYRHGGYGSYLTRKVLTAVAWRLPLAMVGAVLLHQAAPLVVVRGPSMIPTLYPDGSEIYLSLPLLNLTRRGDLVGFAHPSHPESVSVKRIVGVEGDEVPRYGQYALHYISNKHDSSKSEFGIPWNLREYKWVDRSCPWDDATACHRDAHQEARRTLVVPSGHVWLEADCPKLGIDSRQLGPIPIEWLRARIALRLWPLARRNDWTRRPLPVSLDDETLRRYNLHRVISLVGGGDGS